MSSASQVFLASAMQGAASFDGTRGVLGPPGWRHALMAVVRSQLAHASLLVFVASQQARQSFVPNSPGVKVRMYSQSTIGCRPVASESIATLDAPSASAVFSAPTVAQPDSPPELPSPFSSERCAHVAHVHARACRLGTLIAPNFWLNSRCRNTWPLRTGASALSMSMEKHVIIPSRRTIRALIRPTDLVICALASMIATTMIAWITVRTAIFPGLRNTPTSQSWNLRECVSWPPPRYESHLRGNWGVESQVLFDSGHRIDRVSAGFPFQSFRYTLAQEHREGIGWCTVGAKGITGGLPDFTVGKGRKHRWKRIPLLPHPIGFLVNCILTTPVIWGICFLGPRWLVHHRRVRSGRCMFCGYPYANGRCPECGQR